ncbi:MAG: Hsp20/alpha crystallin family protein [Gemmatimonadales bacterium]
MYLTRFRRPEPAQDLFTGLSRLNRLMDEVFGEFDGETIGGAWTPRCDIREDKDYVTISLDLPGVRPEDVQINLENQVLTIRGERQQVEEKKEERWHRYERSSGSFERSFTLPSTVDPDRIEATTENGVLTVRLPKSEKARPKEIPIRTSAGSRPETITAKARE